MKSNHRLKRLLTYSLAHRPDMIKASIFSIVNKIFDVFPEILIGVAIDVVVEQEQSFLAKIGIADPRHQLALLAVVTLLIWVSESLSEYGAVVRWRNLAQEIQHKLRLDGVSHIQKLSLSWYEEQNSGQLLAILNDDVNQVERFLNEGLHNLIQMLVSSLLIGAVFLYLSPIVALFAILPIPIIILGGFRLKGPLAGRYSDVRQRAAQLGEKLSGVITGVVTIRASVAEDAMVENISRASQGYIDANREAIRLSSAFVPIIRMAVLAGFLVTLVLGGLKTLDGSLAPAAFTVLVFLTQRLLWPFTRFGDLLDLYERSLASAQRVLDLIATPIDIADSDQTKTLERIEGRITFKNVEFAYPGYKPVLNGFNLDIQAGEFIGIVGSTGSGKSTLIKLLLRFYDPQSGNITIDGVPIDKLSLAQLRNSIGYVGQDVFLMDASIEDNLLLGKEFASHEEITAALQASDSENFVNKLPEQLGTAIGERGQRLSGGQRQRLTIARGILGQPPILVFDEATSAVDNETEEAIQKSLQRLAHNRTMIVIAHRLSTIRHADKIIVLQEGTIAESGRHDELVESGQIYKRLWDLQTGVSTEP
ncbi:ABC transporter ATP-binding protein [Pseudobacteriovorax antillogorgiicola]|uniref:ATP-binding cassette, subfamily B n=1 Tax=Pseudobacteriovorax antillogorgiicola TaxID=1513793 RepID=A0A1Y6CTM8_9BACT|nr:ABC transporter ATP-binding protein [Pseudobacteriovorax antillogorgiicola]TCS44825.1 ATP-binding cassette subfamily B protein [Pseudobacteriovorax antillogorgiicola]SMF77195.1 ATP-binding cassette, subfamily B [Pseudobacteriovorax antillogorgiicola]